MEGLTIKETGFYEMLLEQRNILHSLAMRSFCLPRNTQQLKEDKDGWMIAVVTDDSNRRKETRNWVDSVVGCRTGRLLGLLYNVLLRKSHWQGGHFSLMLRDGSIWSSSSPLQRANWFHASNLLPNFGKDVVRFLVMNLVDIFSITEDRKVSIYLVSKFLHFCGIQPCLFLY